MCRGFEVRNSKLAENDETFDQRLNEGQLWGKKWICFRQAWPQVWSLKLGNVSVHIALLDVLSQVNQSDSCLDNLNIKWPGRALKKTLRDVGCLRYMEKWDINSKLGESGSLTGREGIWTRLEGWWDLERKALQIRETIELKLGGWRGIFYFPVNVAISCLWAHKFILLWDKDHYSFLHVTWLKWRTDKKTSHLQSLHIPANMSLL